MRSKAIASFVLVGLLLLGNRAAHAQFAVIDVGAIAQLISQGLILQDQATGAAVSIRRRSDRYAVESESSDVSRVARSVGAIDTPLADRLTINAAGQVGLGVAAPSERLEVAGKIVGSQRTRS